MINVSYFSSVLFIAANIPSTVRLKLDDTVPSELVAEHENVPVSVNWRSRIVSIEVIVDSPVVAVIAYSIPLERTMLPLCQAMAGRGRPVAVQVNAGDSPRRFTTFPGLEVTCGLTFGGSEF